MAARNKSECLSDTVSCTVQICDPGSRQPHFLASASSNSRHAQLLGTHHNAGNAAGQQLAPGEQNGRFPSTASTTVQWSFRGSWQPCPASRHPSQPWPQWWLPEDRSEKGAVTFQALHYYYFVKWLGYGPAHNTWEPEKNLINCSEVLQALQCKDSAPRQQAGPPSGHR